MFENMGKKNEEKPPPQPVAQNTANKFNTGRMAFVQKLQTQPQRNAAPATTVVKATKETTNESVPDHAASEQDESNATNATKSAKDATKTGEANKEKEKEKEAGKAPIVVRMASTKKDGYASKMGGGEAVTTAGSSNSDSAGTASTVKKNMAASRGLNINLGALRPGATYQPKRRSEGMSSEMTTPDAQQSISCKLKTIKKTQHIVIYSLINDKLRFFFCVYLF
ncbi:hypothetical protein RFI_31666, partial [Reticulomyxa filosa]